MKIAVIGAGGWLGGTIAREALSRGIEVTAMGRDVSKLESIEGAQTRQVDATNLEELTEAVSGHDAVVGSVTDRSTDDRSVIPGAARALVEAVSRTDAGRIVWVGGGGSLHDPTGTPFVESPDFPAQYKAESEAGAEALRVFRDAPENVDWAFLSPPVHDLHDGPKGEDELTVQGGDAPVMAGGEPAGVSSGDLAVAVVDEIEQPQFTRQRFTLGYAGA
jgi:putative NADH-flavin reductase